MGRTLNTILAVVGITAATVFLMKNSERNFHNQNQVERAHNRGATMTTSFDYQKDLGAKDLNNAIEYMYDLRDISFADPILPMHILAGRYWHESQKYPHSKGKIIVSSLVNELDVNKGQIVMPVEKRDEHYYRIFPFKPIEHFDEITIDCNGRYFPRLRWRNVEIKEMGKPSSSIFCYKKVERAVNRNSNRDTELISTLEAASIGWVNSDTTKIVYYSVHLKPGTQAQSFLVSGGVDPEDWPIFKEFK